MARTYKNEGISIDGQLFEVAELKDNSIDATPVVGSIHEKVKTLSTDSHTADMDQFLDYGGPNEVSAADLRNELDAPVWSDEILHDPINTRFVSTEVESLAGEIDDEIIQSELPHESYNTFSTWQPEALIDGQIEPAGRKQITGIKCNADLLGLLGGKYWYFYDQTHYLNQGYTQWNDTAVAIAVWYNAGSDTAPTGFNLVVEVSITINDTAATIAAATAAALNATPTTGAYSFRGRAAVAGYDDELVIVEPAWNWNSTTTPTDVDTGFTVTEIVEKIAISGKYMAFSPSGHVLFSQGLYNNNRYLVNLQTLENPNGNGVVFPGPLNNRAGQPLCGIDGNFYAGPDKAGRVFRIEPETGRVTEILPNPFTGNYSQTRSGKGVSHPNGKLYWTANYGTTPIPMMFVYDVLTETLSQVSLPNDDTQFRAATIYLTKEGDILGIPDTTTKMWRYNVDTEIVTELIDWGTGNKWQDATMLLDGRIYVMSSTAANELLIDTGTWEIVEIPRQNSRFIGGTTGPDGRVYTNGNKNVLAIAFDGNTPTVTTLHWYRDSTNDFPTGKPWRSPNGDMYVSVGHNDGNGSLRIRFSTPPPDWMRSVFYT